MLTLVYTPSGANKPVALLNPRENMGAGKARFGEAVASTADTSQAMVDTVTDFPIPDELILQAKSGKPEPEKAPAGKKRRILPKWALLLGMVLSMFVPDKSTVQRIFTGSSNGESGQVTLVQPPPPDPTTGIISRKNNVQNLNQYSTNGCGTTSLAMAQNTVQETTGYNREVMDREVRRADIYTSPESMIQAARTYGAYAEIYNHQTFADIQRNVDAGNPVIVLFQHAKRGEFQFSGHYVVVSGYNIHPNGKREIICEDPATGKSSTRDFELFAPSWQQLDYGTVQPGFNNLMIVLSKDPLPPSNYGYKPLSTAATNAANLIHTSKSLLSLDGNTLLTRDTLNGNLLRLALILAGGFIVIRPRKPADTLPEAEPTKAGPPTQETNPKPRYSPPLTRPVLSNWLSANEPMIPA